MSATIDNRIVKLQFDNKQFESSVSKSISTLDRLKEKLQFKNATKGVEELQTSINKVQFGKIEDALDKLTKRFSTFGIAGMEVIKRIANSALDAVESIGNKTLGQVKSGGWSRAMKIAQARFSAEGMKFDWEKLKKAINYGVQDTAYGFDSAAKAASTLAAAGVDFEKAASDGMTAMHRTLRGISGVAAMTSASYDEIADIFMDAAGMGRASADTFNRLAQRGLNAASILAKQFKVSEADIKEFARKGQISFEDFAFAMDNAFGEHAKEANKTFEGSLSNMKASLSRIGAVFAGPVIDKTNVFFNAVTGRLKEVEKMLGDVKAEDGTVVKKGFTSHFAEAWESAVNFATAFVKTIDLSWLQSVADWMDDIAIKAKTFFDRMTDGIKTVSDAVKTGSDVLTIASDHVKAALEIFFGGKYGNGKTRFDKLALAGYDAKTVQKFLNEYIKANFDINKMQVKFDDLTADQLKEYIDALRKNGYDFKKAGDLAHQESKDIKDATDSIAESAATYANAPNKLLGRTRPKNVTGKGSVITYVAEIGERADESGREVIHLKDSLDSLSTDDKIFYTLSNIWLGMEHIGTAVSNTVVIIKNALKAGLKLVFGEFDPMSIAAGFEHVTGIVENVSGKVREVSDMFTIAAQNIDPLNHALEQVGDRFESIAEAVDYAKRQTVINDIYKKLKSTVGRIKNVLSNLAQTVIIVGGAIFNAFRNVFQPGIVSNLFDGVAGGAEKLSEVLLKLATKAAPYIEIAFTGLFKVIKIVAATVTTAIHVFSDFISEILGLDKASDSIEENVRGINDVAKQSTGLFGKIASFFNTVLEKIPDVVAAILTKISQIPSFFKKLKDALDESEGVQRLKDAFTSLGDAISDHLGPAIDTVSEGLKDLGEGDTGKSAFDTIISVIDFLADKLAWVIEKLPVVANAIAGFFSFIKGSASDFFDTISGFFSSGTEDGIGPDGTIDILHQQQIQDSLSPNSTRGIMKAAHTFGEGLSSNFVDGAGNIDLGKIGGILALFGIAKVFWNLGTFAKKMRSIPKSIEGLFRSIKSIVSSFGTSLELWSLGEFITTVTKTFAEIVLLCLLISQIPDDMLSKGIAVLAGVGALFVYFVKTMSKINGGGSILNQNRQHNVFSQSGQVNIQGMYMQFPGMLAMVGMMFAIGYVIKQIAAALKTIGETNNIDSALANFALALGAVVAALVLIAVVVKFFGTVTKKISVQDAQRINDPSKTLLGLAAMVVGIGIAMLAIAAAVAIMPNEGWVGKLIGIGIIIAEIFAFSIFLTKVAKDVSGKTLAAIGLMIISAVAAIGLILFEIAAFAVVLKVASVLNMQKELAIAAGIIAGFMILVGVMIYLATKNAKNGTVISSLAGMFLSLTILVGVMAIALWALSGIESGLKEAAEALAMIIAVVGLFSLIMILCAKAFNAEDAYIVDEIAGSILTFAIAVAAVGLTLAELAKLPSSRVKTAGATIGLILGVFAGLATIIGLAEHFTGGKDRKSGVGDSVALVFDALASALFTVGLACLAVGAGMLLFSYGIDAVVPFLPTLIKSVDDFFKVLEDHWAIVLVILGVLAVLAVIIKHISAMVKPFAEAVADSIKTVVKKVAEIGSKFIEKGLEFLSKAASKIGSWFSGLGPKAKGVIVALLLAMGSAVTETGPQIFQKIGQVLFMAIDWLTSIIVPLADKIVRFIAELIDAVGQAITKHSGRIAVAIWSVISSLIVLAVQFIEKGLNAILGGLYEFDFSDVTNYFEDNMKRMRKSLEDAGDEANIDDLEFDKKVSLATQVGYAIYDNGNHREAAHLAGNYWDATDLKSIGFTYDKRNNRWVASQNVAFQYKNEQGINTAYSFEGDEKGVWREELEQLDRGMEIIRTLGEKRAEINAAMAKTTNEGYAASTEAGNETANKYTNAYNTATKSNTESMVKATKEQDDTVYGQRLSDHEKWYEAAQELVKNKDISLTIPAAAGGFGLTDAQARELSNGAYDGVQAMREAFSDGLNKDSGGWMDKISNSFSNMFEGGSFNIKNFMSMEGDGAVTSFLDSMENKMSDTDRLKLASSTAVKSGVTDVVKDDAVKAEVDTSFREGVVEPATYAIRNSQDDLEKGMTYAMAGLMNGFLAVSPGFRDTWQRFVDGLPKYMTDKYKIESPSRLFSGIGENVVLGFANGITNTEDAATGTMTDLSDQIIKSFGNPLDIVRKVAAGELQYDPSIRPVLDMTTVSAGAQSIDSMFANQNVTLSGISGQLAADIGEMQASNADIIAELQALRADMSEMSDNMENLQVVMDSGVLVGAIAPGVDKALGMRNIYKGRGN